MDSNIYMPSYWRFKIKIQLERTLTYSCEIYCVHHMISLLWMPLKLECTFDLHVTLILMLGLYWYITVVVVITTVSKIKQIISGDTASHQKCLHVKWQNTPEESVPWREVPPDQRALEERYYCIYTFKTFIIISYVVFEFEHLFILSVQYMYH